MAAFFLVRFRLHEANRQEHKAEHSAGQNGAPSAQPDRKANDGAESNSDKTSQTVEPPIWSSNPQLEQVGPFRRGKPPTHLLEACHTLCMIFAVLGFILAMVGVLCYVWAMLPRSSQVLSTVAIGVCLIASTAAILLPQSFSLLAPVHVIDNPGPTS